MPPVPETVTGFLTAAILVLLGGTVTGLLGGRLRVPGRLAYLPGAVGSGLAMAAALQVLGHGRALRLTLPLGLGGTSAGLAMKPLGAWFVLAAAGLGLATSLAGGGGLGRNGSQGAGIHAAFHLLLLAVLLVLTAGDALAFLFAWELIAVAGWMLLALAESGNGAVAAEGIALRFFTTLQAGAACLAGGFFLAAGSGGPLGLSFAALGAAAAGLSPVLRAAAFLLFLAGFATSAGLAPFHGGRARAAAAAPPAAAALFAGALPLVASYGLVRVLFDWLQRGPAWWGVVLVGCAAASLLHCWLLAVADTDLRRVLGYAAGAGASSTVLALGIGAGAAAHDAPGLAGFALAVTVFAALSHAALQATGFLAGGTLIQLAGTAELGRMGGLLHRSHSSSAALLLGGLGAAGLPPFGGFVTLWLTGHLLLLTLSLPFGAFKLPSLAAMVALALASALGPVAMLRLLGAVLFGPEREGPAWTRAPLLRLSTVAAAAAALGLGLFAGPVLQEIGQCANPIAGYGGSVLSLTLPAPERAELWPETASASDSVALARLSMPALVSALLVATLAPFLGLRLLRGRAALASTTEPLSVPESEVLLPARQGSQGSLGGPVPAGIPKAAARISPQGFAQPFAAALGDIYGSSEEATILEGPAAHFPTRIAFHHSLASPFAAWGNRLIEPLLVLLDRVSAMASAPSLRARMAIVLGATVALLAWFAQ